jgi:hypothetical protein
MSAVLHPRPNTRWRLRDQAQPDPSPPPSFPKQSDLISGEAEFTGQLPPPPNVLLSPLEQEILSVCLQSPEDPRDIGILPALLSVERRRSSDASGALPCGTTSTNSGARS